MRASPLRFVILAIGALLAFSAWTAHDYPGLSTIITWLGYFRPPVAPDSQVTAASIELANSAAQRSMAWTSYWLMIVSCVGLVGVVGTLYEARRLFKETRDSNFIQREIGWNQTRAYVTVSNCTFSMEPGNIPTVRARFKNNGSSPAKDMVIQRRLGFRMVPHSPSDFDLPHIEGESRISLGSGSEIEIIQDAPPMAPEVLAAYEGELGVLVFFGEVTYRDIFNRAFVTKFRMTRKRSQRPTAMTFTAEGNSST